jgi:hypothetical protein
MIFKQKKYSPAVYRDPSVSMTMPNENSSEFKNTPHPIVCLKELHESPLRIKLEEGINHLIMELYYAYISRLVVEVIVLTCILN